MYKCVKFIVLLKHTLKNKHLIIMLKKKKTFQLLGILTKKKKKDHNSRRTYIKGGKKKKDLKMTFFDVFLGFTKTTSFSASLSWTLSFLCFFRKIKKHSKHN